MIKIPSMEVMLKAGVHFGHRVSNWHPKAQSYLYTVRNGVHIIDVKKTAQKLEQVATFVSQLVANGGDILFVGTKDQAKQIIKEAASAVAMPYINNRWLGGTITNFDEIKKSIQRYLDLKNGKETGDWQKYTKKEQGELNKDLERLEHTVSGLVNLKRAPKAVFIIDIRHEKTAVAEANVKNIPVIAVCDSNVNADLVQYPIPGNDDATKALELYTQVIMDAVKEGLGNRKVIVGDVKNSAPKAMIKPKPVAPKMATAKPTETKAVKAKAKSAKKVETK